MKVTALTLKKHFIIVLVSVLMVTPFCFANTSAAETTDDGYATVTTYFIDENISDEIYYDGSSGSDWYRSTVICNINWNWLYDVNGYISLKFYWTGGMNDISYTVEGATVIGSDINSACDCLYLNLRVTSDDPVTILITCYGNSLFSYSEIYSSYLYERTDDSSLENIEASVDNIEIDVDSMLTYLQDIYSLVYEEEATTDNIYSLLQSMASDVDSMYSLIESFYEDLDEMIDTISWNSITDTPYGFTSDFSTIYTDMSSLTSSYTPLYFLLTYNVKLNNEGLYKISIDYDSMNNFSVLNLYLYSNGSFFEIPILYHTWDRYHLNLYFSLSEIALGYSSPYYFCVQVKKGQSFVSGSLSYIQQSDIEYWTLMNFFVNEDSNSILETISEYVQNIFSVLSDDDGASDEAVSTADQLSDTVSEYQGIESSFTADFSTDIDSITSSSSWDISSFATTVTWFSSQLEYIYDYSGDLQLLFTLPMLLGIALYFIGRGHMVGGARETETLSTSEDWSTWEDHKEGRKVIYSKTRYVNKPWRH